MRISQPNPKLDRETLDALQEVQIFDTFGDIVHIVVIDEEHQHHRRRCNCFHGDMTHKTEQTKE